MSSSNESCEDGYAVDLAGSDTTVGRWPDDEEKNAEVVDAKHDELPDARSNVERQASPSGG